MGKWTGWGDYDLLYTNFISLSDTKSELVSPVTPVYMLKKKREIKKVSALTYTRLPCSLVP